MAPATAQDESDEGDGLPVDGPGTGAAERAWAEAVVQTLPEPILLVDTALVILTANSPALSLLGRDRPDVLGLQLADLLVEGPASITGPAGRAPCDVVLPDGTARPVDLDVRPIYLGGRVQGGVVLMLPPTTRPATAPPARAGSASAELAADLESALRSDEIVLHYQPIVALSDQRPVAAEALVRWQHPQRGLLSPAEFLDLVDTPSLALGLGTRVLREACHAASGWTRTSGGRVAVQVSVNLSERQILQPGTVEVVRQALTVAACPPDRLIVEVTESALLGDPEAARRALLALKDVGVQIAIDDVGALTAPLSFLTSLPVDLLKIDRTVVADIETDPDQAAVTGSLVSLAHAMKARCVAEGVETAEQLAVLRRLGCDLGQGYLFTRALNHRAATQWLIREAAGRLTPATGQAGPGKAAQRAMEMQAEGASLHTIAARLNAEGHRNTGGRRWQHTSVAQLVAAHREPPEDR